MKTKWADNSKDFLKNLLRNLDLVDVNFWKLIYVNFVVLELFILSKHLLVRRWFGGIKQSSERCLSVVGLILDR